MPRFRYFISQPASEQDLRLLGDVLFWERTETGLSQRGFARVTGFTQQKVSAYESGRVTPSWRTFVRLLASMSLRPVLETEPLVPAGHGLDNPRLLFQTIDAALEVIGDRPHRIAGATAVQVLGGEPTDVLQFLVEGDPARLDDLAIAAEAKCGAASTRRGRRFTPRVCFAYSRFPVELHVYTELDPAVEVEYHGRKLAVAPPPRFRGAG